MASLRTIGVTRRGLWHVASVTATVHLLLQLLVFLPDHWRRTDSDRDVTYLYEAATRVRTGEPLYRPWPEYGPHVHTASGPTYSADRHPYPPFLATALAPFTALPYTTFASLWYIPLIAAFWVYAWSLSRLVFSRSNVLTVLVAGQVLALFPGTYRALSLGQVDPILWALFGLALVVPSLRGFGFGISAAVKLYAGWPLLIAWLREGRRPLLQALTVAIVGVAISGFVLGFRVFFDWARYMLPVISQGSFNSDNVSLSFAGLRLASVIGWDYVPGPLPAWARFYLLITGTGAPLLTAWHTRRLQPAVQYACVGTAAVLFGPLCWSSYLPLVLAPLAAGWRQRYGPATSPIDGARADSPPAPAQVAREEGS